MGAHPDADSAEHTGVSASNPQEAAANASHGQCLVCLRPLDDGVWQPKRRRPRRVHPGRCARVRKSELQNLRRRRG